MAKGERIALINPNYNYPSTNFAIHNRVWPPICLANCATLLEKDGFDVKIIDANAEKLSPRHTAKMVKNFDKVFVTSTPMDRWQCPHTNLTPFFNYMSQISLAHPNNLYLMGTHGTVRPEEMLRMTKVDAVIRGEPELTVLEISKNQKFEKIKGITYWKNNRIVSNPSRPQVDMGCLTPAFHLLPMKKYFFEVMGKNFTMFESSRGCPFNCIFCLKSMYGDKNIYRIKDPKKFVEEISGAVENYGIKNACFMDLEFTINRKNTEKICDLLIRQKHDLNWYCQTRVDSIDRGLIAKMKMAGCTMIGLGAESGSKRILEMTNKKIGLSQLERGVKLIKSHRINTVCYFMFGLPTETMQDMKKTVDFAMRLNPTYPSFHVASPYPGTAFYSMVKNEVEGLFPEVYTGCHSAEALKSMVRYAFIRFYARPSYIISSIKTSNHFFGGVKLFLNYLR